MRLACLSDIHANPFALEACLDHAEHVDVDGHLVAGDVVGKGPLPGQTLEHVRALDAPTVKGNVDRTVVEAEPDPSTNAPPWTASRLTDEQRATIADWPTRWRSTIDGTDVLLVHGSPLGDEDFLFPSITEPALARKLDGANPDVLVCGHTHLPFAREIGDTLVVNAGTAGLPYDGDPRASYATIALGEHVQARIHRVSYDVEQVVAAAREHKAPGAGPRVYRTGTINGIGP